MAHTPIFKGIATALITPMNMDGSVDYEQEPLGTLLIYLYGDERSVLVDTPDKKDVTALEEFGQK